MNRKQVSTQRAESEHSLVGQGTHLQGSCFCRNPRNPKNPPRQDVTATIPHPPVRAKKRGSSHHGWCFTGRTWNEEKKGGAALITSAAATADCCCFPQPHISVNVCVVCACVCGSTRLTHMPTPLEGLLLRSGS